VGEWVLKYLVTGPEEVFCKHGNEPAGVPYNAPNVLTGCITTSFSGRILLQDGAN